VEKNILEMKDITKEFPGIKALNNVSIKVKAGEIHALVGENGAGKSTLMKILSGAYPSKAYSGTIFVDGSEKKFNSTIDSEDCGIEMIYQELSCMLDMNIAENIFIGNYYKKNSGTIDWKKIYKESEDILERVGLKIEIKENMRSLSASEQQLVMIAKAIRKRPRVLVLDEPTSTLTIKETENLMKILLELKKSNISCIYISHRLNEVFEIADRITVLKDGEVQGEIYRENFKYETVVEKMIGRKIENMYPKEDVTIGDEVLRVEDIVVQHPYNKKKNIVDGVTFSVKAGEILGLAGLVGAGRSELVNAVFASYKGKYSRRIYLNGKGITINSPVDALRHGLGLVTEDRKKDGIIAIASIRENISVASLKRLSRRSIIKKNEEIALAEKMKDNLNIKAESINAMVLNLSGGNQQKVVLAKWLSTNPRILFLDEPTRGIDVGAKVEIYKTITKLAAKGMGIVMISSELIELMKMCDRFLVLNKGKISAELSREDVSENAIMMAATGAV
jgi:ABC-type sugar transport system ATPase subunit